MRIMKRRPQSSLKQATLDKFLVPQPTRTPRSEAASAIVHASREEPRVVDAAGLDATTRPPEPPSAATSHPAAPYCKHLARGFCRDGTSCLFSHHAPPYSVASGPPSRRPQMCSYYHRPCGCFKGASCPALHHDDWKWAVVRFPWSPANTVIHPFYLTEIRMWDRVSTHLSDQSFQPRTGLELEMLMGSLLPPECDVLGLGSSMEALIQVVELAMDDSERYCFFHKTLPWMRRTVCETPKLFSSRTLPLLERNGTERKVTVTDYEVAALLCCAFFSLFPERHGLPTTGTARKSYGARLPSINFAPLYGRPEPSAQHKIRALLEYFEMRREIEASGAPPTGIEVIRVTAAHATGGEAFRASHNAIVNLLTISEDGTIEECPGTLQVDFANKSLGGGVIGRGCVQEEIRFITNPELFVARLLCEELHDNEVVYVCGARQYTKYTGYAQTFQFAGRHDDGLASPLFTAPSGAVLHNVAIVAMDATNYHAGGLGSQLQYTPQCIAREADKALAAFSGTSLSTLPTVSNGTIATGNWGCGAFGGDHELKFLIQLCAASVANRPLHYYTFGDAALATRLRDAHAKIVAGGMRVAELYRTLEAYNLGCLVQVPLEDDIETDPYDWYVPSMDELDDTLGLAARWIPQAATATTMQLSVLEYLEKELSGED